MTDDLVKQPFRCLITGNPVGTDTVMVGGGCKCQICQAADRIERLREENRMYWTRYWNMASAFERRGNALHRIASMRSDPEFGTPPIENAINVARAALGEKNGKDATE